MALPEFNEEGDLPVGVHQATMGEVALRFGSGSNRRERATLGLLRIWETARATGRLQLLVIYGSYVTAKPEPNDVDVVLIMQDEFDWRACDENARVLFDHALAAARFGASVFWTRPAAIILDSLDSFIAGWQMKRGKGWRGVVVVQP